jgi:putative membrane protein
LYFIYLKNLIKGVLMSTLWGLMISVIIVGVFSVLAIWIVSKLHLGFEVDGFGNVLLTALAVAIVAGILTMVVGFAGSMDGDGLVGGIVHLVASAIVLIIIARLLPGVRVSGFIGVIVASIAIGLFYWLGGLLLGALI